MANIVQRQSFDADYVQRLINSDSATERAFVAYFGELLSIKLRSRLRSPDTDSGRHAGDFPARTEDPAPIRHRESGSAGRIRQFRVQQRSL